MNDTARHETTPPTEWPTVGMMGLGNMGLSIARGFQSRGGPSGERLLGTNRRGTPPEGFEGTFVASAVELVERSELLILGVKPQQMEALRDVFRSASRAPAVVVSLAAGLTFEQLHAACVPSESRIVRVMPNVAAEVGRSTNGLCVEAGTSPAWVETVRALFSTTGRTVVLANEQAMHGFTAVAGSGPAFVCLFAEALADAAVAEGIPRAQAREIAASMIAGTADLLLESGIGPGPMKDRVTSPAGTTIEGVLALEAGGFRATVAHAVRAAAARSRALAGQ